MLQLFREGRRVHPVDHAEASRLHALLMELIRAAGLLQSDGPAHTLSLSQAFALHELDTGTGLSQRDLAERLRLEKSSVSRLAAEMERNGFLVRERDPDDQRQYRLRLTDEGRAQHAAMRTNFHERYEQWVTHMTAAERAALLKGLPALIRVMRDPD
jgi:DNA-binding MarR family transcriptional regulator